MVEIRLCWTWVVVAHEYVAPKLDVVLQLVVQ